MPAPTAIRPASMSISRALICDELKITCTIQMRRFDTLVPALTENRGEAADRLDRGDSGDAQGRRFQRSLLPRCRRASWPRKTSRPPESAAGTARRQEGRGGRAARAHEAYLQDAVHRSRAGRLSTADAAREALRRGEVDHVFRRRRSRCRSGSTARIRQIAARLPAGRSSRANISAKASASPSGAATIRCGSRCQLGAVPAVGEGAASPICGCGISRSVRSEHPI